MCWETWVVKIENIQIDHVLFQHIIFMFHIFFLGVAYLLLKFLGMYIQYVVIAFWMGELITLAKWSAFQTFTQTPLCWDCESHFLLLSHRCYLNQVDFFEYLGTMFCKETLKFLALITPCKIFLSDMIFHSAMVNLCKKKLIKVLVLWRSTWIATSKNVAQLQQFGKCV